jgi:hypothetical protein
MVEPAGTGPGKLTADGCAVDLYRQLPALGEAEIVHAAIHPDAAVLDLGCGTGRITHPLVELGHPVASWPNGTRRSGSTRSVPARTAPSVRCGSS